MNPLVARKLRKKSVYIIPVTYPQCNLEVESRIYIYIYIYESARSLFPLQRNSSTMNLHPIFMK